MSSRTLLVWKAGLALLPPLLDARLNGERAPLPSVQEFRPLPPRLPLHRRVVRLHLKVVVALLSQVLPLAVLVVRSQAVEAQRQMLRLAPAGQVEELCLAFQLFPHQAVEVELGGRIAEAATPLRPVRLLVRLYPALVAILPLGLAHFPRLPPVLWMQPLKAMIPESSQVLATLIRQLPSRSWTTSRASRCKRLVRLCEIKPVLVPH